MNVTDRQGVRKEIKKSYEKLAALNAEANPYGRSAPASLMAEIHLTEAEIDRMEFNSGELFCTECGNFFSFDLDDCPNH